MGPREPRTVLSLMAAALLGGALPAACSSFGSDNTVPALDGGEPDAQGVVDADADASPNPDPDPGTCPPGAFCDEFDDGYMLPRMWNMTTISPAGRLVLSPDGGLDGGGAIVMTAMKTDAVQSGFLTHVNPVLGRSYTFILRFSAKVTNTGSFLLGPRFVTSVGNVSRHIAFDFENGKVRLEEYDPSCDGGTSQSCSPILGTATAIDEKWHRYVLRGNVRAAASGFGDVSLDVDGQTVVNDAPLTVPFSEPDSSSFYVGLTSASANAIGTLVFDDVQLEVKQ